MLNLDSNLETEMVAASVVVMLCVGTWFVWLLFRHESHGGRSPFPKMMSQPDDEIEEPASVPLLLPSFKESFSNGSKNPHDHGVEALNLSMRLTPRSQQPKKVSMEPLLEPSRELQDEKNTGQTESSPPSSWQLAQKSVRLCSEQEFLGSILVLDDDADVRQFVRIICENSGYHVVEAEDCAHAIKVLTKEEGPSMGIDIIITDLSMPKLSGFEAITYFQKEFSSIPLIALTGIADLEMAISMIGEGVNNYLVKPVESEQLKATVAGAIRHRQLTWA